MALPNILSVGFISINSLRILYTVLWSYSPLPQLPLFHLPTQVCDFFFNQLSQSVLNWSALLTYLLLIRWSVVHLPGATSLKKTNSVSQQIPTASRSSARGGSSPRFPSPCWDFVGLVLVQALCMPSQALGVHRCKWPVVSGKYWLLGVIHPDRPRNP